MINERTGKSLRQMEHICGQFVPHIFRNVFKPIHGGDRKTFEVMT